MWPSYSDRVPTATAPTQPRHRAARAVVVAALVTPAVVLAHLLTRGALPGTAGLLAVAGLAGLVTLVVPAQGRFRLAAVVVAAQVAGHTLLAATSGSAAGCLPAVGRGARAGLRLALLRTDAVCEPGTLAAAPALTALVGSALTGLAVVAGHLLVASLSARLVGAWETLLARVADVVAAVLPALPRVLAPVPAAPRSTRPVREAVRPAAARLHVPAPLVRRGPPLPAV